MITSVVKPRGITSHDVVNEIRKITGERRVGHGGTLDPFAEGVLVIAISRESTKKLGEILLGADKEYLATIELGKTSSTGDPEGKIQETTRSSALRKITESDVENILNRIGSSRNRVGKFHVFQSAGSMDVSIFSRRYSSSRRPYARRWMTRILLLSPSTKPSETLFSGLQ